MKYSLRRWLTMGDMLIDDSSVAYSPEDAVKEAERLSGILRTLITEERKQEILNMEPGDRMRIKKPKLKFTLNVRRVR